MAARKSTDYIAIHCSASRPSQVVNAKVIRQWHKARGFKDIGYHYVILRDGTVEKGRPEAEMGAHVGEPTNYNPVSVGVCLVGGINDNTLGPENNFTDAQWGALTLLLSDLTMRYPKARVWGHRDFPGVKKACPCFDAKGWAKKKGFRT